MGQAEYQLGVADAFRGLTPRFALDPDYVKGWAYQRRAMGVSNYLDKLEADYHPKTAEELLDAEEKREQKDFQDRFYAYLEKVAEMKTRAEWHEERKASGNPYGSPDCVSIQVLEQRLDTVILEARKALGREEGAEAV